MNFEPFTLIAEAKHLTQKQRDEFDKDLWIFFKKYEVEHLYAVTEDYMEKENAS